MKPFIVWIALILLSRNSFSQSVYTPISGSKERKEILDIIRKPIQKDLKQEVKFIPNSFRVNDKWAFLFGQLQQKDGKDIDRTLFLKDRDQDDFWDNMFVALLQKNKGQWVLVQYHTGCTDVCWEDWCEKFKVPKELVFGK